MDANMVMTSPVLEDGAVMWQIARSIELDANSQYKYLLFCRDFAQTSVMTRVKRRPAGFVTGYLRPQAPDTLFIWQIGVLPAFRGCGIAGQMLDYLYDMLRVQGVRHLEATVTPENHASLRLFSGFAERHDARLERSVLFPASIFVDGHPQELLLRISPVHPGKSGARSSMNCALSTHSVAAHETLLPPGVMGAPDQGSLPAHLEPRTNSR
jgi:diaminobutyrate acetyltransferase